MLYLVREAKDSRYYQKLRSSEAYRGEVWSKALWSLGHFARRCGEGGAGIALTVCPLDVDACFEVKQH